MKKYNPFLKYLFALLLYALQGVMLAQDIDLKASRDTLISIPLSEVVITATRGTSLRLKTPEAIEGIKDKAILQYQLRSAPEALSIMPGVFIQKTNHGGGSPFLRGLTGNQTLMLIDGIRLSNATMRYGPNQYLNTIDIFGLEEIEVLRGSGSVQYGSDAMGGTIQAFSRNAAFAENASWGSSFLTRVATQGMEQSLHTGLRYSSRKSAFRGGLSWRNFGDLVGGDTTGRQSPTGYREFDFDLKGKIKLTPSSVLTLVYQNVHQTNVPVYHKVALENYAVNKMDPQNRKLAYIRFNQNLNTGIWRHYTVTASLQHTEEGRESRKNGSDILRRENDRVRSMGFSAEALTSDGNIWSANSGIEIYNDMVNSRRTDIDLSNNGAVSKRGLYPDGSTMTSIAVFTVHHVELPKWKFTAGFRFNSFVLKVEDGDVGTTKLTPSALVGNIALMRKLNSVSYVFVSVNTGFRAPNIDDLGSLGIVDFRYEVPNFDLKPEHSFQYQFGYKVLGQKFRGELFLYRNELYNLIVRNRVTGDSIEGYPVYRKENAEHSYIQGLETAWEFTPGPAWRFSANLTYAFGRNITRNEPVRRIPPVFGLLAAEYRYKNWWYCFEWQAAGTQDRLAQGDVDDNRIPDGGTPGWNIFNLNMGYAMRILKLDISLQNIFDKDYRYHGSGVNGYGRSALLTVRLDF